MTGGGRGVDVPVPIDLKRVNRAAMASRVYSSTSTGPKHASTLLMRIAVYQNKPREKGGREQVSDVEG
jgi:hypothetical protein